MATSFFFNENLRRLLVQCARVYMQRLEHQK